MATIKQYIAEHENRFIEELFDLIRIPSISAKTTHKEDMIRCAEAYKALLLSSGFEKAEVMPTKGNPVVYAERIIDQALPTVLVYGHYDVMPAEPIELWKSGAFEPEIRDGHIWARGADDDKGQSMVQIKGFETALKLGYVNCNVKVIMEGEEEVGSPSLEEFCIEHKEKLRADIILVSDTSMISKDVPSICTGLRGLAYWEIEVTGPSHDLHSGHFGGAVANPINELCKLIAGLTDEDGKITIPHFYDDVEEMSPEEREMIKQIPFSEEDYKKFLKIDAVHGEKGYHTLERNSSRPSLDCCGIWGGYTGEGAKTVLPSKAYAKVSTRLVANQDFEKISIDFVKHIKSIAPDYIKVKVTPLHGGCPYICPTNLEVYKVAEEAFEVAFGKRPLARRSGGSIPIIATFERVLGLKSVLMGVGLESNAIHSPNENISIDIWKKGIEAVAEFYKRFGHK